MKKIIVFFVLCFSILSFDCFSQIEINNLGYVGINQSNPSYNLDLYGTGRLAGANGALLFGMDSQSNKPAFYPSSPHGGTIGSCANWFYSVNSYIVNAGTVNEESDENIKENIGEIDNALDKILKIRGVRYDLKKSHFEDVKNPETKKAIEKDRKNQIGFLAQELEEVFPELVRFDSIRQQYSVCYTRFVPILVEAIKELETALNNQEDKINALEEEVALLKSELGINDTKKAIVKASIDAETPKLYQNTPNPFTNTTKISYYLPEGLYSQSAIYIYDMNGSQLKSIVLNQSGNGQVSINSNELDPGMYMYALVVDGNLIDTKKMILTD